MRCKVLFFPFLFFFIHSWSQNPITVFSIPERNVTLPCGTTCTTITASVPHIKQTNDYLITSIPYLPYAYTTPTGNEVSSVYTDDTWSEKISIGFPFCFYGITYPTLVMGSNSIISFDSTRAGNASGYVIDATTPIPYGDPSNLNLFARASIFGPYHDINPSVSNNPDPTSRKIEWRVEGTAPKRRFIGSYNAVRYYATDCGSAYGTHQMVIYESTGIIEVYIKDKPVCVDWNDGLAILGVQDETRTRAVAAAGRNATMWGSDNMNEAYRFTPNSASPRFKNAVLLVNGNVVAQGDTISGAPGMLDLNFPNVCPTEDSTAYVLRVTYGVCNDPSLDVSFDETVFIKRPTPVLDVVTQNATCSGGGMITANVTSNLGGTFEYSLNGGTLQTSNVFNNVTPGNYTVAVQGAGGGCAVITQTTISLENNLTVTALPSDTSVCIGASFVPRVTSNATSFTWTPSAGVSSVNMLQPTITTGNLSARYIITANQGSCQVKDTISVSVFPGPQANAGPDLNVILGDQVQLMATAATGSTLLWSPSTGLSASNILRPFASPLQTTTYTLTASTAQGCASSDDVLVTVLACGEPMNAFSPNGDGINDRWLITNNNCFKSARVDIFNRYGARVFEDASYSNNWDGTYKGKALADGTYYYIVTYELVNGKKVYRKGNVTILR